MTVVTFFLKTDGSVGSKTIPGADHEVYCRLTLFLRKLKVHKLTDVELKMLHTYCYEYRVKVKNGI